MIVGLYGILKAGGAYVPIDPAYAAERVAYMIEDTGIHLLLTQQRFLKNLPKDKIQVICLDSDWGRLMAGHSVENPDCTATPDNAAYVIYTSGSTGKPKGVINTHGGILNSLLWMQQIFRLTQSDSLLQKTQISFDASTWEFFWPLMFGARLVVALPEGQMDIDYIVSTITNQGITVIFLVPSMLQMFLENKDAEKCHSLRLMLCGGGALPVEINNRFFTKLGAPLHNLYGPTEAAVEVPRYECRGQAGGLKTVPIGRPGST